MIKETPMVKSIQSVLIFVSDMDRSVTFYRDVLGLSVLSSNPAITEFEMGGITFGLQYMPAGARNNGMAVTIDFAVDDIQAMIDKLEAKGVAFVAKELDQPFNKLAKFQDPDGNLLGFIEQTA
ncbi:VOC family protein [bacterium]|nr:VOC family protein [bacterium]